MNAISSFVKTNTEGGAIEIDGYAITHQMPVYNRRGRLVSNEAWTAEPIVKTGVYSSVRIPATSKESHIIRYLTEEVYGY